MTMSPGAPGPTDFEDKTVPPYEGRRETADVDGDEGLHRDGANVGGATGPVASEERQGTRARRDIRRRGCLPGRRAAGRGIRWGRPGRGVGRSRAPRRHRRGARTSARTTTTRVVRNGRGDAGVTEAARVLVAGIGNVFRSDDGFGPEVARRLAGQPWPEGVRVTDYGIRGLHLAYDLLDPWDALVLVDALPDRGEVGAVAVLDIGPDDVGVGRAWTRTAWIRRPCWPRWRPSGAASPPAPSSSAARSPRPATAWDSRRRSRRPSPLPWRSVRSLVSSGLRPTEVG